MLWVFPPWVVKTQNNLQIIRSHSRPSLRTPGTTWASVRGRRALTRAAWVPGRADRSDRAVDLFWGAAKAALAKGGQGWCGDLSCGVSILGTAPGAAKSEVGALCHTCAPKFHGMLRQILWRWWVDMSWWYKWWGKQNKGLIIGGLSTHNKKNLGIIYQLLSMGQVESTRRSWGVLSGKRSPERAKPGNMLSESIQTSPLS